MIKSASERGDTAGRGGAAAAEVVPIILKQPTTSSRSLLSSIWWKAVYDVMGDVNSDLTALSQRRIARYSTVYGL
jgi:hypothetical protein